MVAVHPTSHPTPTRRSNPTSARLVGLLGGESTGKSTLAESLRAALGAVVVPDLLRAFVVERGVPPTRDEQQGLLHRQRAAEQSALASADGIVVGDPSPAMTAVYSVVYFHDDSLLADAVDSARSADLLVWCGCGVPWHADAGQRDGPVYRAAADRVIAATLAPALAAAGVPVLRVDGDVTARTAAVVAALQER